MNLAQKYMDLADLHMDLLELYKATVRERDEYMEREKIVKEKLVLVGVKKDERAGELYVRWRERYGGKPEN